MGNNRSAAVEPESMEEQEAVLNFDCSVKAIAEYIRTGRATNIVCMVGAGISVSAGIPDFRTPGTGLYDNLAKYNLPNPQVIFEINYFRRSPDAFYQLAKEMWPGQYNPTVTHFFIRLLHDKGLLSKCLSQNIDSLETVAGLPADKMIAAHGNFDSATCIATNQKVPIEEVKDAVMQGPEGWKALRDKHGGLVKPDIVFFGEGLPAAFGRSVATDVPEADLMIVMGTSLQVMPFAAVVNMCGPKCPRLLINREAVGERLFDGEGEGFRFDSTDNFRDVAALTDCDRGVRVLARELGWQEELEALYTASTGKTLDPLPDDGDLLTKQWRCPSLLPPRQPRLPDKPPREENRMVFGIPRHERDVGGTLVQWAHQTGSSSHDGDAITFVLSTDAMKANTGKIPLGELTMHNRVVVDGDLEVGETTLPDIPGDLQGQDMELLYVRGDTVLGRVGPFAFKAGGALP